MKIIGMFEWWFLFPKKVSQNKKYWTQITRIYNQFKKFFSTFVFNYIESTCIENQWSVEFWVNL